MKCARCKENKENGLFTLCRRKAGLAPSAIICMKCTSEMRGHVFGATGKAKQQFAVKAAIAKRGDGIIFIRKALQDQHTKDLLAARKKRLAGG